MREFVDVIATEDKKRNQGQIFSTIKCMDVSEVTLTIHITMDLIYLRFQSRKTLTELESSQYPKKDPNLIPKCQQILKKTDENAT